MACHMGHAPYRPRESTVASKLPFKVLAYDTVKADYHGQVQAILRKAAASKSASVRGLVETPQGFTWSVAWSLCDNAPLTASHMDAIRSHLAANSQFYLKASAIRGRSVTMEPIHAVPTPVASLLEQKARRIYENRKFAVVNNEEPRQLIASNSEHSRDIMAALEGWLATHPGAHEGLATVARSVIFQLLKSTHTTNQHG